MQQTEFTLVKSIAINQIKFDKTDNLIAISQNQKKVGDSTLVILDLSTNKKNVVEKTTVNGNSVGNIIWKGSQLIYEITNNDNNVEVKIFDLKSGNSNIISSQKKTLSKPSVSVFNEWCLILVNTPTLIDIAKKEKIRDLSSLNKTGAVIYAQIIDENHVLIGTEGGKIAKFNFESGEEDFQLNFNFEFITWNKKYLAAIGGGFQGVGIWDIEKGTSVEIVDIDLVNQTFYSISLDKNGDNVAFGGRIGHVMIYSLKLGKEIYREKLHKSGVNALSFSNDASLLASGGMSGDVCIIQV